MRFRYVSALVLASGVAFAANGADPPKVDPVGPVVTLKPGTPVTVEVGKKCVIPIDTTAKKVTWRLPPGIDSIPLDGKRLAVWAPPCPLDEKGLPIPYLLIAQVPNGDEVLSTEVLLTVTGPRPPPPSPVVNQLLKDLQTAFDSEPDPAKIVQLVSLTGIMESVVPAAKASGTVTTERQLQDKVHQATDLAVGIGKLPAVRKVIGDYLVTKLGKTNAAITEAFWTTAATEYATVTAALKKVGGK